MIQNVFLFLMIIITSGCLGLRMVPVEDPKVPSKEVNEIKEILLETQQDITLLKNALEEGDTRNRTLLKQLEQNIQKAKESKDKIFREKLEEIEKEVRNMKDILSETQQEVSFLKQAQEEEDVWKTANTIEAVEEYLELSREGKFAGKFIEEAHLKLEELYLQKAKDTNTIEAYEKALDLYSKGKFKEGRFKDEVLKALQALKDEIKEVEEAAKKVLPKEAKVEVTSISQYPRKPEFLISAHLLEGHSADETSPYVQGDYGTHEKLTRLVRLRCATILKSVATGAKLPDASAITIKARHGVRQSYIDMPLSGTDVAMTIYQISISIDEIKKHDWSSIKEEEIMELWKVDENVIPSLQIRMVPFFGGK